MKILFRWLFGLLLLLFAGLLIGGFVFQDELLEVVQKRLNENIPGKLDYQSARLSLIRKFPMASVRLRQVYLIAPQPSGGIAKEDTLAGFENFFVQIHLLDLLKKKYAIQSLHADNGRLFMYTNEQGDPNYSYFLQPHQKSFGGFIDLQSMRMTDCRLEVMNLNKDLEVSALINRLDLKGTFARDEYALTARGDFRLHSLKREGVLFFDAILSRFQLDMKVQNDKLEIHSGDLQLGSMDLHLNGSLQREDGLLADVVFQADQAALVTLVKILPKEQWIRNNLSDLRGVAAIKGSLSGRINPKQNPRIQMDFHLSEGGFRIVKPGLEIRELQIKGSYDNGERHTAHTSEIQVKRWKASSSIGAINGSFTIFNLVSPELTLKNSGTMDLGMLSHAFTLPPEIESMSGKAEFTLHTRGKLTSWEIPDLPALKAFHWEGRMDLSSGRIKLYSLDEAITGINGGIRLGDHQSFEKLSFQIGTNDYLASGRVDNLLDVLFKKGSLWIQTNLNSGYTDFAIFRNKEKQARDQKPGFSWPRMLHWKCKADIKKFEYKNFKADDLKLWFRYDPGQLQCYDLHFQGMSGTVKGTGEILADQQGQVGISTDLHLETIDIHELFTAFNDFGQEIIQKQHLRGRLTGDLSFFARTDTTLRLQSESILAQADVLIREGALIGFEPLDKLAAYIDISELQEVRFSELNNQIIIRNSKVVIPEMEIESSALDMTLSGNHPFDNMYHYRVKLLMSDLLFRKWKRERANEAFPYIEESDVGKPVVFLSIQNTPEGAQISYDKKAAVEHFKQKMDEESRELKTILHEEFGMFKKDSLLILPDTNHEQRDQFIIEWDEDQDRPEEQRDIKEENPRFEIEWEETPDSTFNPGSIY